MADAGEYTCWRVNCSVVGSGVSSESGSIDCTFFFHDKYDDKLCFTPSDLSLLMVLAGGLFVSDNLKHGAFYTVVHRAICSRRWLIGGLLIANVAMADEQVIPVDDDAVPVVNLDINVPSESVIARPRWELGVGGGYFSGFDYPASRETNERAIAVPFFIYRSPRLRLGDGGIRAVAIERPRLKLDLSISGSLNASTRENSVRQGMDDLDFLFEIGPQLEVRLFDRSLASGARVRGRLTSELRAVFSTDFNSVDEQGFVADVGLGVNVANVAGTGIGLLAAVDVVFATEKLHDYFYQVDQEFVTATRPAFDARGGFLESSLVLGFAFSPFTDVRVFTGVIQGFFGGARNEDSPLFEVTQQTRVAVGIVWTLLRSKTMVNVVDLGRDN